MIPGFAFIRPPRPEDLPVLAERAREDHHGVAPVSWVVEKNGEQVGYFSVSPSVLAWLSTKRLVARDTFHLINTVENLHGPVIVFPVPKASPMHGQMESLGFRNAGEFTLFVKGF